MPKILDVSVEEVKRRADVVDVVQAWGVALKRAGSGWVACCPFHEEKSGSFHVRAGKGYRCFGCGVSGDALKFVMAKEGCTFVEAVEKLASKFGVVLRYDEPIRRGPSALAQGEAGAVAGGFALPEGVDAAVAARAMRRQAAYERQREAERRLEEALLDCWRGRVERKAVPEWSDLVQGRWSEGARAADDFMQAVSSARGWPGRWVSWLVDEGVLSWPAAPWSGRRAGNEPAFRVDVPVGLRQGSDPTSGGDGAGGWCLRPVGYHQVQFFDGQKQWVFVPWPVDPARRGNAFLRALGEGMDGRGEGAGLPSVPFVLGRPGPGVRFCVVSEGQWDGVTFAGAMGWLDGEGCWPEEVLLLGCRGSTGAENLLAYWGDFLESVRPAVLVLADNDEAGKKWDAAVPLEAGVAGSPLRPTFAQRLERRPGMLAGEPDWVPRARAVRVSRVREGLVLRAGGRVKDFNDYWRWRGERGRPIGAPELWAWLAGLGLCAGPGRWL